ncbi:hypothetical protein L5515_006929 [Caenorhabditis briggsae]|uniref:C2H2-type domain-containing protein n=1 Tax=Caenorhabditis briggsae TaxID=6238 RepID=A0AAE9JIR5_CAEBR|nr:hypothetical protein L5515_006929 [Caenorhabditis briggsae]
MVEEMKSRFFCKPCSIGYKSGTTLNRHRETAHSTETFCLLCKRYMAPKESIRSHIRKEHYVNTACTCRCSRFFCKPCSIGYKSGTTLNRHRETAHSTETFCLLCKRYMAPKESIRSHIRKEHYVNTACTCRCCNWTFADLTALHAHTKSISSSGTPGPWQPLAKCDEEISKKRQTERKMEISSTSSSSPTTSNFAETTATSPEYYSPTRSSESFHNESATQNHQEMLNKAVAWILDQKIYQGDQLTIPKVWAEIYQNATSIVQMWQVQEAAKKQLLEKAYSPDFIDNFHVQSGQKIDKVKRGKSAEKSGIRDSSHFWAFDWILNESALKPVEKSKIPSKIDNPNSTSAVKYAEGAEPAKKPRHDLETSINTRFEQDKGVQSTSISVVV